MWCRRGHSSPAIHVTLRVRPRPGQPGLSYRLTKIAKCTNAEQKGQPATRRHRPSSDSRLLRRRSGVVVVLVRDLAQGFLEVVIIERAPLVVGLDQFVDE